ncbi:MAG: cytochrome C peroxidase [Bacteroidia bacterium]|nr:cytochrome C peroxidase [Bacteroidia bacterium]
MRFASNKYYTYFFVLALLISLFIGGCGDSDVIEDPNDLTSIDYSPTSYEVPQIDGFPVMPVAPNNPLTVEGIFLGRKLFYDPILSADSTMSCASCHLPELSFTDNLATSAGIDGIFGKRSSMSLLNVGYYTNGFFWDGRVGTLEEQALLPVEDPIELHDRWPNVVMKLQRHQDYPADFRRAFGIDNKSQINRELAARAIAQFETSLISSGNSKYDRVVRKEEFFTEAEENGFLMFFDAAPGRLPDAECGHCHNAPLFTTNEYANNGLDEVLDLNNYIDKGRGTFTRVLNDNGQFRIPTLRNISFSAPYMHDGRFATLEEVIDHYISGGQYADNRHPLIQPLGLSEAQKADLLAFIRTLDDVDALQNPAYQNPF